MRNILFVFYLIFFHQYHSQESDSLVLMNNKKILLSPLNLTIKERIKSVKITEIKFIGTLKGYGKPNNLMISGLNNFLLASKQKEVKRIKYSYYVQQGKIEYYIRSFKFFNLLENQEYIYTAKLYDLDTQNHKYSFIIICNIKPLIK